MTLASWIRIALIAVGALALAALVWFAGQLVAFGESRPFESTAVRGGIAAAILILAVAIVVWRIVRARRKAAKIASALTETEDDPDALVLRDRMRDALATLKSAQGSKGDYLYDIPWYLIIGPPGSGKTTALVNSGLKFPLARGVTPAAIAGVGGTRYCDWWFTENAVFVDTAGRYTTQDSDTRADQKSWLSFLDLLKRNRPRQPINGVLVAISIEDLLTLPPAELAAHSAAIRARLLELYERLKVDFPVYVVFTKADLIGGFREFFADRDEAGRRVVWGATFQTDSRTLNLVGTVPEEIDALVERLSQEIADRTQEEPDPVSRVRLFGFPAQMAGLKQPIASFLNQIFEPTRYHANATLRGFYFTSGTQEGTPIDQLMGALSRNFGAEAVPASSYSGTGRSYFLGDLLEKVVIGEAAWVSTDPAAVRRQRIVRWTAMAAVLLATAGLAAAWWTSYSRNRALIDDTAVALDDYRKSAGPLATEKVVSDRDFAKVLPALHKLRYLPAGYGTRGEAVSPAETLGLGQRDRLRSASETAYQTALERMFRSRLIWRLEEQLEAARGNAAAIYEPLKVYLMLGGLPDVPVDKDLIRNWMARDWSELYPGAANASGRQALADHLDAMLDLGPGDIPIVELNGPLVQDSQNTLARLSVAQRAYEYLKAQSQSQEAAEAGVRDWVLVDHAGPDAAAVFVTTTGEPLDKLRVPGFYTYLGFHRGLIDKLDEVADRLDKERWVMGQAGQQTAVAGQYERLPQDLLDLYAKDFVTAWKQLLGKLSIKPLTADKPRYTTLSAAAAATSPLRRLLEAVRDETVLTRELPSLKQTQSAPSGEDVKKAADAVGQVTSKVRIPTGAGTMLSKLGKGPDRFGPGGSIEAQFRPYQEAVEGEAGKRPIDAALTSLDGVAQALLLAAGNPAAAGEAAGRVQSSVANLRAASNRLPPPVGDMVRAAAGEFEGDAASAMQSQLTQALAEVGRVCQQTIANRYPFVRGTDRDVSLTDFGRIFGQGGVLDKFFEEKLAPHADRSRQAWGWRADSRLARGFSPAPLRDFQKAAQIRDAFFPAGGQMPQLQLSILPLTQAVPAKLDIGGTTVTTVAAQAIPPPAPSGGLFSSTPPPPPPPPVGAGTAPTPVLWPSQPVTRSAVTVLNETGAPAAVLEKTSAWSLYRLLDAGSVLLKGDKLVASFGVGGRQVSYQIAASSQSNPLNLSLLRDFRCPGGL